MSQEKEFDEWASTYDTEVETSGNKGYPFEGYFEALNYIQQKVLSANAKTVLDVGIGTGNLSQPLYQKGIRITGIDFSKKMLDKTKIKMPESHLLQCDMAKGLPAKIKN